MNAFRMPEITGNAATALDATRIRDDGPLAEPATSEARTIADRIVSDSTQLAEVLQRARLLAGLDVCVLLCGEPGVGKEAIARAIHDHSPQRDGLFVTLDCAALPRDLLASELFGYADASFNGARRSGSVGKIEAAHGGTLYLDEVSELPLELQLRLLRVLESREVLPPGSNQPQDVQFRLLAASSRDLRTEVNAGRFRSDLYLRISLTSLEVPALRERIGDLPELVEQFSADTSSRYGLPERHFSPEVLAMFARYSWPGNLHELEEVVEQMVRRADGELIGPEKLPEELHEHADSNDATAALHLGVEQLECDVIGAAIRQHQGNLTQAARALRIARSTLYLKMKKYSLELIRDEVRFTTR